MEYSIDTINCFSLYHNLKETGTSVQQLINENPRWKLIQYYHMNTRKAKLRTRVVLVWQVNAVKFLLGPKGEHTCSNETFYNLVILSDLEL